MIYSRKRFLIPKVKRTRSRKLRFHNGLGKGFLDESGNNIKDFDLKSVRKVVKVFAIVLIAVCIANRVICSIEPVINASCREMARRIATKICNEQATIAMRKL